MESARARLDIKYVFDENIERVWNYIRNPFLLYQFCPELCIEAEHPINNHVWEEGNTFIITLPKTTESNECTLKYTVLDSVSEPYHKFLKFQIQLENELNCVVKKTLYHVSTDDATVVIYEMCNSEIYNESQVKILQNLFMRVLTKMDSDLKREVSDFFQYEGLCMNLSCDKLIRDVINGEKMENIEKVSKQYFKSVFALNPDSPSRENMPLINSEPKDCNTIKKFGEYLLNKIIRVIDYKDQVNDYKIKSFITDEYDIKTIIDFETLTPNEYKIKISKFTFVNIDDNHSYFSICDFFDSRDSNTVIEKLSKRKLEILAMLKETLEQREQ
jgi:hypothetical protein